MPRIMDDGSFSLSTADGGGIEFRLKDFRVESWVFGEGELVGEVFGSEEEGDEVGGEVR